MAIGNYALGTMPLGMPSTIFASGIVQAPLAAVGDASTYTAFSLIPHGVGLPALDIPLRAQQFAYSAPDGFSWNDDKGLKTVGRGRGMFDAIARLPNVNLQALPEDVRRLAEAHRAGDAEAVKEFTAMVHDYGEHVFSALNSQNEEDYKVLLQHVPFDRLWAGDLRDLACSHHASSAIRICTALAQEHIEFMAYLAEQASFPGGSNISSNSSMYGKEEKDILLRVIRTDVSKLEDGVVARLLKYIRENHSDKPSDKFVESKQLATLHRLAFLAPDAVIPGLAKEFDNGNPFAGKVLAFLARQDARQVTRYFRISAKLVDEIRGNAYGAIYGADYSSIFLAAYRGERESAKALMDIVALFEDHMPPNIFRVVNAIESGYPEGAWLNFVHAVLDEAENNYPPAFNVIKWWVEMAHEGAEQFVYFLRRLVEDKKSALAVRTLFLLNRRHAFDSILREIPLEKLARSSKGDIKKFAEYIRGLKLKA